MPKRFSDNDIWTKQRWFKDLAPLDKLVFFYIKDACDYAGFYEVDVQTLCEHTGLDSIDLQEFIKNVNKDYDPFSGKVIKKERLKIVDSKYIWITGFVAFQYENKEGLINPNAPVVKGAISILKKRGVYEESLQEGFLRVTKGNEQLITVKDKDKDKEKDKDKDKEYKENVVGYGEKFSITSPSVIIARDYIPQIDNSFHFNDNYYEGDRLKILKIIRKLLKELDVATVRRGFDALIRDGTTSVSEALNLQYNGHNITFKFRDLAENGGSNGKQPKYNYANLPDANTAQPKS